MVFINKIMDDNTPSGIGNHKTHICHKCGWPFPNHHPSARHRRAHKKICGTIEGFKIINSEEKTSLTAAPKSPIVCYIKGQVNGFRDDSPLKIMPANAKITDVNPTSTPMDPEVNYTANSIVGDNARDHEKNGTDICSDIAGNECSEGNVEENLQLNTKAIALSERNLSESEVFVKDGMDKFVSNMQPIKSTHFDGHWDSNIVSTSSSHKGIVARIDSTLQKHQEKYLQGDYEGCKFSTCSEIEEEFTKSSQVSKSDMLQKASNHLTLRDVLLLPHDDDDESFVQSAAAVNENVMNMSISTDSLTLSEADIENLKNSKVPLEVYLLEKFNKFEPSFREIFASNRVGRSTTVSSEIKAQQKVNKPNWIKKIDNVIAKLTKTGAKKKQTPTETILSEVDVKGIWKSRLESERKKSEGKKKPSWGRFLCFHKGAKKVNTRRMADWEIELKECSSSW